MRYDEITNVHMQVPMHNERDLARPAAGGPAARTSTRTGPALPGPGGAQPAEWEVRVAGSGMPARRPGQLQWRKSHHSNPSGNCVEVAGLPAGGVAVRDSRDPGGPVLMFARKDWQAFLRALRG